MADEVFGLMRPLCASAARAAMCSSYEGSVGERSSKSKKFLRVTKINLGDASNEREGEHLHTLEDR